MKAKFSLSDNSLNEAMTFIDDFCEHEKLEDNSVCFKLRLVYEELITNIFKHAVKLNSSFFVVSVYKTKDFVEIELKYDGEAFDPTKHKDKRASEPFSQNKKEGGLGLFLVFNMSRDFRYSRKDGLNVVNVKI